MNTDQMAVFSITMRAEARYRFPNHWLRGVSQKLVESTDSPEDASRAGTRTLGVRQAYLEAEKLGAATGLRLQSDLYINPSFPIHSFHLFQSQVAVQAAFDTYSIRKDADNIQPQPFPWSVANMLYSFVFAAVLSAALTQGVALPGSSSLVHPGLGILARQQSKSTCLQSNLIQSASGLTGQESGTSGIKAGQAKSETVAYTVAKQLSKHTNHPSDKDNFINFCAGQTITNGQQITAGSCNGIPMGKIPAQKNMISAIITNPQPGTKLQASTTFNVSVQTTHLKAGVFVNPTTNYYTAPQDLDGAGDIIGHCHVTIQDIGSMDSTTPPDPSKFAFFKGIDDAGNGKGLLQATVSGGLPAGTYRVCTMIAAANHQPVAMPVAQRGAQDDCTKFERRCRGAKKGTGGATAPKPKKSGTAKDGKKDAKKDKKGN
ncbi:LOW QUALITY PROTEIN: ribosomal protein S17 [Colletotrichum tofieldiae]|nr:LOW QUALITY PROTEIN: ribosomal protein S17 [Colletotrichum tofieldiae]